MISKSTHSCLFTQPEDEAVSVRDGNYSGMAVRVALLCLHRTFLRAGAPVSLRRTSTPEMSRGGRESEPRS